MVTKLLAPASDEQKLESVIKAAREYIAAGVTTSIRAGTRDAITMDLQNYSKEGLLPFRLTMMANVGRVLSGFGSDMMKIGAIKILARWIHPRIYRFP